MNWLRTGLLSAALSLGSSCTTSEPIDPVLYHIQSAIVFPRFSDLQAAITDHDSAKRQKYAREGRIFYDRVYDRIDAYSLMQATDLGSDWWHKRIDLKVSAMRSYNENRRNPNTVERREATNILGHIAKLAESDSILALDSFQHCVTDLYVHAQLMSRIYNAVEMDIELKRPSQDTLIIFKRDLAEAAQYQQLAKNSCGDLPANIKSSLERWLGEYIGNDFLPLYATSGIIKVETDLQYQVLGRTLLDGIVNRGMN